MSALSILVNCIILCVAFPATFSMPQNTVVPTNTIQSNKTANTGNNSCSCPGNPSKSSWDQRLEAWHSRAVMIHGMVCMCNLGISGIPVREDYKYTPGIGSHKLYTRAETWNNARHTCNEQGGHLAIINSLAEQRILVDLFNRSGPFKGANLTDEVFLGTHDLYMKGDWATVLGEPLSLTGFIVWSDAGGGQPDNAGGKQNCGALLKDGTMDDIDCELRLAYFCEIPEVTPLDQLR